MNSPKITVIRNKIDRLLEVGYETQNALRMKELSEGLLARLHDIKMRRRAVIDEPIELGPPNSVDPEIFDFEGAAQDLVSALKDCEKWQTGRDDMFDEACKGMRMFFLKWFGKNKAAKD